VHVFQEQHYAELKQRALHYDMLIDKLIIKDVQLTARNDDQYFVFEDVLYQVIKFKPTRREYYKKKTRLYERKRIKPNELKVIYRPVRFTKTE